MSAIGRLVKKADTQRIARGIAATRVLLGIAIVMAPRALMRRAMKDGEPSDETVAALRMVGGRDLALGLGGLLAAKRGPHALRGWVEGGMLADAIDVPSIAAAGSLRPAVRGLSLASAATAVALAAVAARRLSS